MTFTCEGVEKADLRMALENHQRRNLSPHLTVLSHFEITLKCGFRSLKKECHKDKKT